MSICCTVCKFGRAECSTDSSVTSVPDALRSFLLFDFIPRYTSRPDSLFTTKPVTFVRNFLFHRHVATQADEQHLLHVVFHPLSFTCSFRPLSSISRSIRVPLRFNTNAHARCTSVIHFGFSLASPPSVSFVQSFSPLSHSQFRPS